MHVKWNMIDKELRPFGAAMKLFSSHMTENKLKLANKWMSKPKKIKASGIQTEEKWLTRKDGTLMRVMIFKPKNHHQEMPGVLWIHGGGYAYGAPEDGLPKIVSMIERCQCKVVAPDYRLSVQAPYPAALHDNYETLLWMKNHAHELGIKDNQLIVAGDSAGGGLTAAVSLLARDRKEVAIAFQMPLYPMMDDRMNSKSMKDNNAPVWESRSTFNGWKLYLGNLFQSDQVPTYAAAARAVSYENLPPTVSFVGGIDPFRDETEDYVRHLRSAGVPVKFKVFEGCYHGFEGLVPKATVSRQAIAFFEDAFSEYVNKYFAEQPQSNTPSQ